MRVRARLGREPYMGLLKRVASEANLAFTLGVHDINSEQIKARAARAAAFLFYLDRRPDASGTPGPFATLAERRAMGERARDALLDMLVTSRSKGLVDSVLDIHTAQELHMWADTLDLLLGADLDVLKEKRAEAVQRVADLAADFYADFHITDWLFTRSLVNNHRTKTAAALGLAALAVNGEAFTARVGDGRYQPSLWLDSALRNLDFTARDILTDEDGGYQEGPGYLAYAGIDSYPFMWAWHRAALGQGYLLDFSKPLPPYYRFHASGHYALADLWTDGWLEKQLLWAVRLMLPDGTLPPVDDSSPGDRFFFGVLVQPEVASAPLLRWAWERSGRPSSGSVDQAPLLLVVFDDSVRASSPEELGLSPSVAFPRAGQVVFRSGWGPDDLYVLLLCEHGKAAGWARTRFGDFVDGAAGHEHPDPGAFMLVYRGETLALDSGYLGWEEHTRVNGPQNHNILLVDGLGPQTYRLEVPHFTIKGTTITLTRPEQEGGYVPALDGMAYLTASDLVEPSVKVAEVVTSYHVQVPRTDLRRRAILLDDRFLLLHDRALTRIATDGDLRYTVQLHGNGGGSSGGHFERHDHGGVWTRPRARLRSVQSGSRPLGFETRLEVHDSPGRKPQTHVVLDATQPGRASAPSEFLTLLAPEALGPGGDEETTITTVGCSGGPCLGWQRGDLSCFAWSGFSHGAGSSGASALVEARAGAYCKRPGRLAGVFEGFTDDKGLFIVARFSLDGAGKAADYRIRVLRSGPGRGRAVLSLPQVASKVPDGACSSILVGDRWHVIAPPDGTITLGPSAQLPLASIAMASLAPGDPRVAALGARVTVTSDGSCGPAGVSLKRRWTLLEKPELSALTIPEAEAVGDSLTLAPDLPGLYQVGLSVEASGLSHSTTLDLEVVGELTWPEDGGRSDGSVEGGLDAGDGHRARFRAEGGCSGCGLGPADSDGGAGAWLVLGLLPLVRFRLRRRG